MKTAFVKAARALTLTGLALFATVAQATPVTYNWSTVATVANATYGIKVGDTISGVISYDITGDSFKYSASQGTTGYQYYNTPATTTTLNAGTYQGTVNLYAMVVNDFSMWGGDEFFLRADTTALGMLSMGWVDSSMQAFSSLALPTAFNPSSFSQSYIELGSVAPYAPMTTTMGAAASVPEPATTTLFGVALAGLALARRRRIG